MGSKILDRGLKILEIIAGKTVGLKVDELSHEMQCHRTTVYRYLDELISAGYVINDERGIYKLGPKLFELSNNIQRRMEVRTIAHPYLLALSDRLDVTVHVAKLIGNEVVIIDKIESAKSLPMYSRIGHAVPLHATGVGKAILAYLSQDKLETLLIEKKFERFTENTIINIDDLKQELSITQERGYSVDNCEHEENIMCVAAPLRDHENKIVAAASATDIYRKMEGNVDLVVKEILLTADKITNAMEFRSEK